MNAYAYIWIIGCLFTIGYDFAEYRHGKYEKSFNKYIFVTVLLWPAYWGIELVQKRKKSFDEFKKEMT